MLPKEIFYNREIIPFMIISPFTKVPPLNFDWLISLKDENEKGLNILVAWKGRRV